MTRGDGPALPLYLSEPGRAMADFGLYLAARPLLPRLPQGDGHTHLGYQDHYVVDGGMTHIVLLALVAPTEVQENQPARDLL